MQFRTCYFGLSLVLACLVSLFSHASAQNMSEPLWQALEAIRKGNATDAQRALLFQNNGRLNNARLNGWMTDAHYQAMQGDFAKVNRYFAKMAAEEAGATFKVQTPKSEVFSPGTDSDFIVKLTGQDPVGQIKQIQSNYNRLVNAWRERCLKPAGLDYKPYNDWHKKLDVDFMADPSTVNKDQFKAIKELNTGAYGRMEAAEYERISRLTDGTAAGPAEIKGYAAEMADQIHKKQIQMDQLRSNPGYLKDPALRGELQKLMALEQKYVERLESMAARLRNQERLQQPMPFKKPEIRVTLKDGAYCFETRQVTAAAKGAIRSPGNMGNSAVGSAVTRNSMNRAIRDLADAMAEAHAVRPGKFPNAARDIAEITAGLNPSEKGAVLERIIRKETRGGKAMARDIAIEMRKQSMASGTGILEKLDVGLRKVFGVTEGLSEMGEARKAFNLMAGKVIEGVDKLGKAGVALQVVQAMADARDFAFYLRMATDPSTTDEDANIAFQKAQSASYRMALSGGMGALFIKVPTLGAVYASATVAYDGTRWFLENTETGQAIDRNMLDFFDRGMQKSEIAYDSVLAYFGSNSASQQALADQQKIEETYLQAIKIGKIKLANGVTASQFIAAVRAGDRALMDKLTLKATAPATRNTDNQGYVAYSNDIGWIHVTTIESFRKPTSRGSEIWGGMSRDPMVYSVMLGGRTFETFDDAVKALAPVVGPMLQRKNAALASPSVYYMAGEKRVGFELVNHPAFRSYVEAANNLSGRRE